MMDFTAYTRGYQHGTESVNSAMSDVESNHSYDELVEHFDNEAEKMRTQGFPEDYVDGYADGYEQRLKDAEDGVPVGKLETA